VSNGDAQSGGGLAVGLEADRPDVFAGARVHTKAEFIASLEAAVRRGVGYAAGRIGISEKHWMAYPILLQRGTHGAQRRVIESRMRYHAVTQAGIFPGTPEFLLGFNDVYVDSVRQLDCLGLMLEPVLDPLIVSSYVLTNPIVHYKDLEPDMSLPSQPERCYLHLFAGKRLLIVCPFADLLARRAGKATFEAVWARTGKKWFAPASVAGLTTPFGFTTRTRVEYATALDLYREIVAWMGEKEFDVAMVAAGGLSVPLAAQVKRLGKIAINFGGELQMLFGVIGARWRDRPWWRAKVFNEAWIDMPASYRPPDAASCNNGTYW
jgi:hypothetical protein